MREILVFYQDSQLVHLLLGRYIRKEFKMLNNFIEYVKQNWQNRPATATPIRFAMTIALMNTEKGHLRLTTALSAAESWWINESQCWRQPV